MSTVCVLWSGWNRLLCFRDFVIVTIFFSVLMQGLQLDSIWTALRKQLSTIQNKVMRHLYEYQKGLQPTRKWYRSQCIGAWDMSNYTSTHSVHGLQCSKKLIIWYIRLLQTFLWFIWAVYPLMMCNRPTVQQDPDFDQFPKFPDLMKICGKCLFFANGCKQ